jgi:uncharacterized protein (DUF4415 family)
LIFYDFPDALLALNLNMEAQKPELSPEFERSNAPPPQRMTVTVDIDADILEWLKAQPLGVQGEINSSMRFIMDMSSQPVPPIEAYEIDAHFTGPEAGPDPARNADRIDNEFIPG